MDNNRRTVPVTMGALIKRINRVLNKYDEVLKVTRGQRMLFDVGQFYIINWRTNWIIDKYIDPEQLGRELGVLKEFEYVAD